MKRVLITGMSGTGKSSVILELVARGSQAIDLDTPAWSETRAADGEWVWREDRVRRLLSTTGRDVLFVSGCASNQGKFNAQFDHIILLSAPRDVILDRLAARTNNAFGKQAEEVEQVLSDLAATEPLLRRVADYEIDTTAALHDVVDAILRLTGVHA